MPGLADPTYFVALSATVARARRHCRLAHLYSRQARGVEAHRELGALETLLGQLELAIAWRVLGSAHQADMARWLRARDPDLEEG